MSLNSSHEPCAASPPGLATPSAFLTRATAVSAAVSCDVAAHAYLRLPVDSLGDLRRQPGAVIGGTLPPSFLKHADEQTVAAMAAVYQAIHTHQLSPTGYTDWAAIAAPRFLGRPAMAAALRRYQTEGAWGVSPHLIPHRSLHSISGTISQALKIHGPNFGVGGGPGGTTEALLSALALLQRQRTPGVWVVLTALDPEPCPEPVDPATPGICAAALALALVPTASEGRGIRLRMVVDRAERSEKHHVPRTTHFDLFRLQGLLNVFQKTREGGTTARPSVSRGDTTLVQMLGGGCRLELTRSAEGSRFQVESKWFGFPLSTVSCHP